MTRPVPSTDDLNQMVHGPRTIEPEPDAAAEALKERISTWLSAAAMIMVVVGLVLGLWPSLGPWSIALGGGLLSMMVAFSDAARRPPAIQVHQRRKPTPPGPSAAGNLHTKGPGAQS